MAATARVIVLAMIVGGAIFGWRTWGPELDAVLPSAKIETTSEPPRTLVIGLDMSASNPLVKDDTYAGRVADRVKPTIASLPLRSVVLVRTFGVYDASSNVLRIDEVMSARAKPDEFAEGIHKLISSIPELVRKGKLNQQMKTNIVPFLMTMVRAVDCDENPTTFVLLTDGVEDSEVGRLTRTGGSLPKPSKQLFGNCEELFIFGLGQGLNSPTATEKLRNTWAKWAEAAGFDAFSGLYDW